MTKVRHCDHCGVSDDMHGQNPDDWTELVVSRPGNEAFPIVGMASNPADLCLACTNSFLAWYEDRP
jgi:hypothetical protein